MDERKDCSWAEKRVINLTVFISVLGALLYKSSDLDLALALLKAFLCRVLE